MTAVLPMVNMRRATDRTNVAEFVARTNQFVDDVLIPLEPAFLQGSFKALKPQLEKARQEARRCLISLTKYHFQWRRRNN